MAGRQAKAVVQELRAAVEDDSVKEGEVYTLLISGVGRKGDGIVRKGKMVVYVNGGKKGQTAQVQIDKVSGNVAFGHIV